MKNLKMSQTLLFSLFIAFVLLLVSTTALEDECGTEFNYDLNSGIGPHNWSNICPDQWGDCNNGNRQSPINLANDTVEIVSHLGTLQTYYNPAHATLVYGGHDISLEWEGDAGHIEINGTEYDLKECHWHHPSEHALDGERFDLEAHLVHQSNTSAFAVIGIMYKIGQPDSFLSMFKDPLTAIANGTTEESSVGIIDPTHVQIDGNSYYRYNGSLTTPPCTQNVVWTVVRKIGSVSQEQVTLLRDAVHDEFESNARPLQPINFRDIQLYKELENED